MALQVILTELHNQSWIAPLKSTLTGWRWGVTSRGIACNLLDFEMALKTAHGNYEQRDWELKAQQNRRIAFDPGNAGYVVSESPIFIFFSFPGEHAPKPPNIIRAFGADSRLVSPVTLVFNVQLQKTPYLDKMNDDTEKQKSKIYIILDKNRSLNTKETIQFLVPLM